jgi:hypothetical protein
MWRSRDDADELNQMRIFLAGIMQGSRREKGMASQDYRSHLTQLLRQHLDGVEIVDPFALHPESVGYSFEEGRRTLIDLAEEAGRSDVVVAFVPEASMGTALEMWQAYRNQRIIFTISPLSENWVIKFLSTRVFDDVDQFEEFVASGAFQHALET